MSRPESLTLRFATSASLYGSSVEAAITHLHAAVPAARTLQFVRVELVVVLLDVQVDVLRVPSQRAHRYESVLHFTSL
jgi:hypothetical protein